MELIMSSQSTTHFPVDAIPRSVGGSGKSDQPVVIVAFAKLVIMVSALAIFTPPWLDLLRELAYGPPPQAWGTLRVVALAGSAAWLALGLMTLKVWTGLLKFLARAD